MDCTLCQKNNTVLCPAYLDELYNPESCQLFEWVDMLGNMMDHQINLQRELGAYPDLMEEQYIKDMILAAHAELTEILNETPWKPWKKNQELNVDKYKEEIIDLIHFVLNLGIAARMDPVEIYIMFMKKNEINSQRKKEGY